MSKNALPPGFRAAGVHCGIKKNGSRDLGLIVADAAFPATALFTRNQLLGAHVHVCRENLARSGGRVRAVLVNSGNANCATGEPGLRDAREVGGLLAELIHCPPEEVLFLSTGVIGARLPVEPIATALPELVAGAATDGLASFAGAILTTDTTEKCVVHEGRDASGAPYRISGIAKGSGMIHPDLATMFAFLLTDGALTEPPEVAARVSERTFQRLSVDGDTSPNDTVLFWYRDGGSAADTAALEAGLTEVGRDLCRKIAADGEGATRLITIVVEGAPSERAAARIGRTIATSPLTKTAVNGRDPNWGRILSAAARAEVPFDVVKARVLIGDALLYSDGTPHPENEPAAHDHMASGGEVVIRVDLAHGTHSAEVWTCDLSADYVRINADYRT